jgi:hypothetical protein
LYVTNDKAITSEITKAINDFNLKHENYDAKAYGLSDIEKEYYGEPISEKKNFKFDIITINKGTTLNINPEDYKINQPINAKYIFAPVENLYEMLKKAKSEKTDVVEENKFDVDALTGEATDTSGSGVYIVDVGLDVYGSEKGAVKLLDELAANESIHINSYSWSDDVDSIIGFNSDGSLYSKKGSKALSISLSLMMYDPDSYISPEDNATEQ